MGSYANGHFAALVSTYTKDIELGVGDINMYEEPENLAHNAQ